MMNDWKEIENKILAGETLTESERQTFTYYFPSVYVEEAPARRWSQFITTVVKLPVTGRLFAMKWDRGLTESQENAFYYDPYEVRLETEQIIVEKTKIIPLGVENG